MADCAAASLVDPLAALRQEQLRKLRIRHFQ